MKLREYLTSLGVLSEFRLAVLQDPDYRSSKYASKVQDYGGISMGNILYYGNARELTGVNFAPILDKLESVVPLSEVLECLEDIKRPSIFKNNSVTE